MAATFKYTLCIKILRATQKALHFLGRALNERSRFSSKSSHVGNSLQSKPKSDKRNHRFKKIS